MVETITYWQVIAEMSQDQSLMETRLLHGGAEIGLTMTLVISSYTVQTLSSTGRMGWSGVEWISVPIGEEIGGLWSGDRF